MGKPLKRGSKGQKVKTFKHWIPNSDLTKTETQVSVYFKADNGMFSIYDGAHMFPAAQDLVKGKIGGWHIHTDHIYSDTMDSVIECFKYICQCYEQAMKNAAKKKVIRFTFKRNTSWDGEHQAADDISFCGKPAVHFEHEVLYQVGDQLYEQDKEGSTLHYRGKPHEGRQRSGDAITIDWTPEREAFFENMKQSLITLIHRVDDFQKNLLVNVDNAIAGGGPLLLTHGETNADI